MPNPAIEKPREKTKLDLEASLDRRLEEALNEPKKSDTATVKTEAAKDREKLKTEIATAEVKEQSTKDRSVVKVEVEARKAGFEKPADQFLAQTQEQQLTAVTGLRNSQLKEGVEATIYFGTNPKIQRAVGLSCILPSTIREVSVNGVKGLRKGPEGNFYTPEGQYLAIVENDQIKIEKTLKEGEENSFIKKIADLVESFKKLIHPQKSGPEANELDLIYQNAAKFSLDPHLLLAIRQVNKGQYGHEISGLPSAQIATAARFLETAAQKFTSEKPDQPIKKGNDYTPEFIAYLMSHYALFGDNSPQGAAQAAEVIKAYAQSKGITAAEYTNFTPPAIQTSTTGSQTSTTRSSGPRIVPSSSPSTSPRETVNYSGDIDQIIIAEAQRLGIRPSFAKAIIEVESGQKGLNSDGTPVIRMEPHIFNGNSPSHAGGWGKSRLTGRHIDNVSCEGGQAHEHACFNRALQIDPKAAYRSISVGRGQIMGFNHQLAGYSSPQEMYEAFSAQGGGEAAQIKGMFKFIESQKHILNAARNGDHGAFTRGYNGSKPGSGLYSKYTTALSNADQRYAAKGYGGSSSQMAA